jgi:hypothetical protein
MTQEDIIAIYRKSISNRIRATASASERMMSLLRLIEEKVKNG